MRNRLSGWTLAGDIRRAARGSPAALAGRQRARLTALVAHARRCAPYYRRLYRDLPSGACSLRQLPPVTKPALMAQFDDWVADPRITRAGVGAFLADKQAVGRFYQQRYAIWTTSGTTGQPGIFVHDRLAVQVYTGLASVRFWPVVLRAQQLWQLSRRGFREAMLVATGDHFAGVSYFEHARQRYPYIAGRLRAFSVLESLPALVTALNDYRPTILNGYPTALELLAAEQQAGRLHIHPVVITGGGEQLTPAIEAALVGAFGCPVYDFYGATEFLYLACSCRWGRLHANTDWALLEPVDAEYRPVPPGTPSHTVLLTNLANWVQPLIRYDLGDSVTLDPAPCPCGSTLPILTVAGRSDDVLYVPGRGGTTIRVLPLALGAVVEQTPGVARWQVIQEVPRTLRVRLQVEPGCDPAAVWQALGAALRSYLDHQGVLPMELVPALEPPQSGGPGGKFRQVQRLAEAIRLP